MIYFHLLNGRENVNEDQTDWGDSGPVVGPFDGMQVIHGDTFHGVIDGEAVVELPYIDGDIRAGDKYYSDVVFCAKDAAVKAAGGEDNIMSPEQFLNFTNGLACPWRGVHIPDTMPA